jgi:hypothetical protein
MQLKKLNIEILPDFPSASKRGRFVHKLAWYLMPCIESIQSIHIDSTDIELTSTSRYFDNQISHNVSSIQKLLTTTKILKHDIDSIDMVLLWCNKNAKSLKFHGTPPTIFDVDDRNQPYSASNFIRAANHIMRQKNYDQKSVLTTGFTELLNAHQASRVLLVGTGPNLEQAYSLKPSFDIAIACNSIVKDFKALSFFNPSIIVAADPVFHVGASKYAEAFRNDLIQLFECNKKIQFVAPLHHKIIYDTIIPDIHKKRVSYLAVNTSNSQINLNLLESDSIHPTNNILTLMMLPIASTIASKLYFAGFDGNRSSPIFYFWKHNKNTQYHELIRSSKMTDPAFFNRSFKKYYNDHKLELANYLKLISSKGISIKSITKTHIQPLEFYSTL